MQFYPKRKKGFIFNEDVAEEFGVLNEYRIYQDDYDYDPLHILECKFHTLSQKLR